MVLTDEERKAKKKAYQQSPEVKAKKKAYQQSPEGKAKAKRKRDSPEGQAKAKENRIKHSTRIKAYHSRPDRKAKEKQRKAEPAYRQWEQGARAKENQNRFNVLQHYSKNLSNSDIPCCNCCGQNNHLDFLAIDHIAGIKKMDFEPELIKLGYSSKLVGRSLIKWIIVNDFPKGFQILCANCNFSKGMKKNNNKCPMENKPH